MVQTNAQNRTFFDGAAYMSIDSRTITEMASKGFHNYHDVAEFDQEMINAVAAQLRWPGGKIEDPNYVVPLLESGKPPAPALSSQLHHTSLAPSTSGASWLHPISSSNMRPRFVLWWCL